MKYENTRLLAPAMRVAPSALLHMTNKYTQGTGTKTRDPRMKVGEKKINKTFFLFCLPTFILGSQVCFFVYCHTRAFICPVLLSVPCVCLFPICVRLIGERVRGGLAGPGPRWGVAEREDTPGGVGAAPSPPSVQKALKNDDLIKMPTVRVIKRKPLNN